MGQTTLDADVPFPGDETAFFLEEEEEERPPPLTEDGLDVWGFLGFLPLASTDPAENARQATARTSADVTKILDGCMFSYVCVCVECLYTVAGGCDAFTRSSLSGGVLLV